MPFTAAHPAAILPFTRLLPFTALTIGAIAPDLEYFLYSEPYSEHGHTLPGLIVFCLPIGLGLWLCILPILLRYGSFLLPESERRFVRPDAFASVNHPFSSLPLAGCAIVLGATTHLVWDAFTHFDGWGVRLIPMLSRPFVAIAGHDVAPYSALQHGGSLVGMTILAIAYSGWRGRQSPATPRASLDPRWKALCWFLLAALPTALAFRAAASGSTSVVDLSSFRLALGRFVIALVRFEALTLLLLSLAIALAGSRIRSRSAPPSP